MKNIKNFLFHIEFSSIIFILFIGVSLARITYKVLQVFITRESYNNTDFRLFWIQLFLDVTLSVIVATLLAIILPQFELSQTTLVLVCSFSAIFIWNIFRSMESLGDKLQDESPTWIMSIIENWVKNKTTK